MSQKNKLVTKFDKLLKDVVKETGINISLPRPFKLTPKDLDNNQTEKRWAAARLLSVCNKKINLPHGIESSSAVILDMFSSALTITALVPQDDLHLPEVAYLLDYRTKNWFTVKLDIQSRTYSEKIEEITFGDSLSFAQSTLYYKVKEFQLLSAKETEEAKKYFSHNWLLGQNPEYFEINSWLDWQFRKNNVIDTNKSNLQARIEVAEIFYQTLAVLNKKSA